MKEGAILLLIAVLAGISYGSIYDNEVDDYMPKNRNECNLPIGLVNEIQSYQPIVNEIINKIVKGKYAGDTYKSLLAMTDKFGARLAGSKSLEDSIDYMVQEFKDAGLENVHTEEAEVPHWVRGYEAAELVLPRSAKLPVLGLGSSIGTPRGGIIGDVIVVQSFDELKSLPDENVKGKIVVFAPPWVSYGSNSQYRTGGASAAAKKGAIAALIRSATQFSIGSPHTGMQKYESGVKQIPAACITVEDAEMLLRMFKKGENIRIHLEMEDKNLEPVMSRNTIGELQGRIGPNKSVVVVSGHLDSWDVGVGAMDDGGGAFISWKATQYLKDMGLRPKRTIRAILWTGEEYGYRGARAYLAQHKAQEKDEFNFFMESDIGTFNPTGLDFTGNHEAECMFKEILKLMKPLNATKFDSPADGAPDVSLWLDRGFPGASLLNENEKYFWFHHSAGDSILLEDPVSLDKCTALFAAAAYVIADISVNFPNDVA